MGFSVATTYAPQSGDYLCLAFLNEKRAAFDKLPLTGASFAALSDAGASRLAFVGTLRGKELIVRTGRLDAEFSSSELEMKKLVAVALCEARERKCKRLVVPATNPDLVRAAHEGAVLGGYEFLKYKTKGKKNGAKAKSGEMNVIAICPHPSKTLDALLKRDAEVFRYTNLARDLLNEPANVIHPASLAAAYVKTGKAAGLRVTVWDAAKLKKERCGGILGVGQGAAVKPRLVIAEYAPRGAKKHLCLVGKGVTFDTGGYCLKPADGQVGMKLDMGGSAMMFAAACAIAKLKLPVRVTLFTPLVENDISSTAYHTTDILTMRSGLTVQVDNTDAEGRLILADALVLASERKPDLIIDAATLTGACVVALGEDIAGAYVTDDALAARILEAGSRTHERFWRMPLHEPYREMLKCDMADCKNIGSRWGGSITAALFLRQFVDKSILWAHLDIAGPGCKETPLDHLGKGAKAFGVKAMVELARGLCG